MLTEAMLLGSDNFKVHEVTAEEGMFTLTISSHQPDGACPGCQRPARRVHSRYWRTPADLPVVGVRVRLRLLVRRFFCDNSACDRKTFAERFLALLPAYARRTQRLAAQQREAGLALGGQAGAKLLVQMAMPTSGDTVLRLVKNALALAAGAARVLGVDDWAWSKGQRYGTILVDLERRQVIDLLPDRSAETLSAWLQAHPGVEIVSRDRALEYIKGIEQGAPNAVQVADRWHLLRNLADALIRLLERNRACLYAAAGPVLNPVPESLPASLAPDAVAGPAPTRSEQQQQNVRERRWARYQAILALNEQGVKVRAIARQLGMSRGTVERYLRAGGFPEMSKRPRRRSLLDAYLPYLEQRWAAGCHNGSQLYREIQEKGYGGSRPLVSRWAAGMRKQEPPSQSKEKASPPAKGPAARPWSARYAVWLLMRQPETLKADKKAALERMLAASPELGLAYHSAQDFIRMLKERDLQWLQPWLNAVVENKIPELTGFARSLRQDQKAVVAALSLPWSNGQVEGQVNRLKMIKRQMYGRAGFDLLRLRVIVP